LDLFCVTQVHNLGLMEYSRRPKLAKLAALQQNSILDII
jgi:hypothetical protein